jgi:hypothetical protein
MAHPRGIEPLQAVLEAAVLPLNEGCKRGIYPEFPYRVLPTATGFYSGWDPSENLAGFEPT